MQQQESQSFDTFVDKIETALDQFVDSGTDHELFLSSYLHGHFSLVVSQTLLAKERDIPALTKRMEASLNDAFANDELGVEDQALARDMWDRLANI